jgi:hypothetical protein
MGQKEIFNLLANGIIDDLPQVLKFKEAILNIMRLEGVVEFNSYVIDETDSKINPRSRGFAIISVRNL